MTEKITILSVDDTEANLYTRGRLLRREGYEVIEAMNGTDALRLVAELKPPLVLLDVQMPDINGLEVCRRIKNNPDLISTFVLQISASLVESQDKARALDGGADGYLTEPVESEELLATVRALLRLQRAEADLRGSQKRLALALQAGRAGTFEWDIPKNEVFWSPELEEMYGVPAGTFEGNFESWVKRVESADAKSVEAEIQTVLQNNQEDYDYEFRVVLPDETRRWFSGRAKFEYDADGKPLRMIGINVDIDDRKQIESERARLLEIERSARLEAENVARLKDEFLATVSHELRTPLNAILGWSTMLATHKLNEVSQAQAFSSIERNARSQNQLIEDLLDVSRIISSKIRLNVQPVALASVIEAAIETVQPSADARTIRLVKILDPNAGPISGDPDRLQQIVWNLLSNAIKFTPKQGKVQIRLEQINSHVEIIVSDTGQGISEEFLPYVFDRFRQADSSSKRQFGGLGLGLSIVRHLTELQGGTVEVFSEGVGLGATFTVKFPRLGVVPTDIEKHHPRTNRGEYLAENATNLSGAKILVVDDDKDTRILLSTILVQQGAEVQVAASVAGALEKLAAEKFTLLISDIEMPGTDGYDFIRQIRAMPEIENLPAVAVTAYARSEDRVRAIAAGFNIHLAKPVEARELLAIIGRFHS